MALDATKDLYDIGEIPPLGHVPEKMHAWAIRRERHGEPDKSFQGGPETGLKLRIRRRSTREGCGALLCSV